MDYSYFTSAPQPYQFFGVQNGHTNGHSQSFDDYQDTISSVSCANDIFKKTTHDYQEHYDAAFAAFQQNFHYDPSTFMPQPNTLPSHSQSPTKVDRPESVLSLPEIDTNQKAPSSELSPDEPNQAGANARSSSEEKDTMTPQQSRRKAQNRAA